MRINNFIFLTTTTFVLLTKEVKVVVTFIILPSTKEFIFLLYKLVSIL